MAMMNYSPIKHRLLTPVDTMSIRKGWVVPLAKVILERLLSQRHEGRKYIQRASDLEVEPKLAANHRRLGGID
jgi:hypothetical protein